MAVCETRERIVVREADPAVVSLLSQQLSVTEPLARICAARGLDSFDSCKRFFRPESAHFHSPFLFEDMEQAVARILGAIVAKERITVYGDYDVDGVTATTVMVRMLRALHADVDYYLPNRLTEGYGMSDAGVAEIAGRGTTLIITVDCGITSRGPVATARRLGCDVIVTDHHEPHTRVPECTAVLNPKIGAYPEPMLAGVGVALKVCQALAEKSGMGDDLWYELLDIVALGTAADIVPMTGENRVIAFLGYRQMVHSVNPGLRALIEQQGLTGKKLGTGQIVFRLAPCINATGRLGDSLRGVKLLLTDDPAEAALYARELKEANIERRTLDSSVQEEAMNWIAEHCDPAIEHALVAAQESWHVGVIGISASKVAERFYRPAFLFCIGEDGLAKGSGRSIPEVHLLDALEQCRDVLESFGGHAAAAGASIRRENIDTFRTRFNAAVAQQVTLDTLGPVVKADAEVTLQQLTPKFFRIVQQMEPFGPGNMRPVLLVRGVRKAGPPRRVGKNHRKMPVTADGLVMDAIGFSMGDRLDEVCRAERMDIACTLDRNEWNGQANLQMVIKGLSL